jgi:hypothetical protein
VAGPPSPQKPLCLGPATISTVRFTRQKTKTRDTAPFPYESSANKTLSSASTATPASPVKQAPVTRLEKGAGLGLALGPKLGQSCITIGTKRGAPLSQFEMFHTMPTNLSATMRSCLLVRAMPAGRVQFLARSGSASPRPPVFTNLEQSTPIGSPPRSVWIMPVFLCMIRTRLFPASAQIPLNYQSIIHYQSDASLPVPEMKMSPLELTTT